jgi:hypothetical protein
VSSVAGRTGAVTLTTADVGGLGTVATLDVAAAGNASATQAVKGNDTRLSDSRTPSSHAGSHAAGGSDPVTLTIAQITGLAESATTDTTNAANISSGTLPDGRIPTALLLSAYQGTAAIETLPRFLGNTAVTPGSGIAAVVFFTPLKTVTINTLSVYVSSTAGASVTLQRLGLYTVDDSTGNATLVARSASSTTMFNTTSQLVARSLDTAGGYPSSYTLQAGTRYGLAILQVATTAASFVGVGITTQGIGNNVTPRLYGGLTSQSDLPASITTWNQNAVLFWGRCSFV